MVIDDTAKREVAAAREYHIVEEEFDYTVVTLL